MEELFYHVQDYLIENLTKLVRNNFPYYLHIAFKLINCKKLQNYIQDYLIERQSAELILENFSIITNIAFKLNNFKKLQDYIVGYICNNSYLFFYTHLFLSLDKDILYKVLESEELQIREVVAWEHLIKWGINQIPGEKCEIDKLSYEAYKELKEILNRFIPLIRFVEITSDDFNDKIKPYKIIIPYQIYEEIEDFYNKGIFPKITLPPRIRKIDSKIIKTNLVKIILNWINKEDFRISLYNFNLIYRGSIDGMKDDQFKKICKGEVKSLVLIKVKHTNEIFGGYSSIGFNSIGDRLLRDEYNVHDRFYYSSDNFIFSFKNDEDTQNMKISRVINYDKAIRICSHYEFSFGKNSLNMCGNMLLVDNANDIYEDNVNTNSEYYIEEIETFVVTKQ
ncbi:unnamed protein product [Rhizophagus irregularis]|nr:unnamed protein product [Rhizophagus irregularis]CAB5395881.1 unnamed protein product [Rhizophagus irregularis]